MKKGHFLRNLIFILLLAAGCITGCELAVCRVVEPDLYVRVTAPVVAASKVVYTQLRQWGGRLYTAASQAYNSAAASVSSAYGNAVETFSSAIAALQAPSEPQVASDPAIPGGQPAADPAITELETINGREVLTGGNVTLTYYNQKDEAWADSPYGQDNIGTYGCGPTAMAMVVASLTEQKDLTPDAMAAWAASAGYWAYRSGSYLSIVEGTAAQYGLLCTPLHSVEPEELCQTLSSNGIIVALMGTGHFTKTGHFILLHGTTLDGSVLVADPNSRENSLIAWNPQLILDELSQSSSNGAPLWLVTPRQQL